MSFTEKLGRTLGRTARIVVKTSAAVASATLDVVDDAMRDFADKKMDKIFDARKEAAMRNEEYAEIQKRRDAEKGPNGEVVLSSPSMPFEDWIRQSEIEDEVAPEPTRMKLYRFLYARPLHKAKSEVKFATQRLTRSWDDRSVWSLDTSLCTVLGAQLKLLSEKTNGMPITDEYPTFEDWQKAISENADALIAYGNHWEEIDLSNEEIEKRLLAAQASLRWVADNLPALWD